MTTALLEIETATTEIAAAVLADYRKLVEATADGKPVDGKKALATLHHCEKTTADLKADAEHLAKRKELAKQVEGASEAGEALRPIVARAAELAAEKAATLQRITAEFNQEIEAAEQESRRLRHIIKSAEDAANFLRGTAPPKIREEMAAIKAERSHICRAIIDIKAAERKAVDHLAAMNRPASADEYGHGYDSSYRTDEHAKQVADAEQSLADVRERLAEAESRRLSLDAEIEELRQRALIPWPADCPTLRTVEAD